MKIVDIYDNGGYRSITDDMLAARLALLGADIPVAALRRRGPVADSLAARGDIDILTTEFGFGSRFSIPYKVRRLSKEGYPVIIHTHSATIAEQAALIARAWPQGERPRIVLELPVGDLKPDNSRIRFAIDETDMLLFHTASDRDLFLKNNPEAREKLIEVIAPGCIVASTLPHSAPEVPTLLWGGRLTARCGIAELIEAVGAIVPERPVKVIVAGQGKASDAVPVLKRVKALGLSADIDFLGDAALTPDMMRRASALVITSENDPFASWSIAMAKASGVPVILPDGLRTRQLVAEDGGMFYIPGDHAEASLRHGIGLMAAGSGKQPGKTTAITHPAATGGVSDYINMYSLLAATRK